MINDISTLDLWEEISADLTSYKYTTEGNHRTDGSYVLTHWKSLFVHLINDPNMCEYFDRLNTSMGNKRFEDWKQLGINLCQDLSDKVNKPNFNLDFKHGLALGVIAGISIPIVYKKYNEYKENKKESKES